jgi:hypothetical protein
MTELTEPDNVPAQPAPEWPQAGGKDITDPRVAQAMARLQEIPRLPAVDHETLYSRLHDDLLAALNSDPTDSDPTDSDPTDSDPTDSDPTDSAPAVSDPSGGTA